MSESLLPLFPLKVVLFPRTEIPLHIFEERYKEMIGECLERRSEFGVVLVLEEGLASTGCTARIAEVRGRRLAVALDEFQAIGAFDGGTIEHALRAAVQQQRQVGYVFAGSEPSLMERMLGRKRPFYKAGPVMRLQKIPADRFAEFVEALPNLIGRDESRRDLPGLVGGETLLGERHQLAVDPRTKDVARLDMKV